QKERDIDEVINKYASYCKKWAYTLQGLERVAKAQNKKTINPLKDIQRFWEPCVIYIYGDRDNFYGSISWTYFLRLTDRNHCLMDIKHGKTNIVAMYICITANGTIENLYKNLRERNSSIDIEAFIRRVRYIIKFEGNPIDSRIGKGNITRIFEKGNKQDFNNRIFDIEFNRETTLEQAKKVTIDLGIKGTIFQDTATGYYYWRQSWENEINKYSTIENIDDITD
ncbi:2875_t:CDS:2, partial [Gigaspora rosea]